MARKPIIILNAKLAANEDERKKAFHSSEMKCLNIVGCLGSGISSEI